MYAHCIITLYVRVNELFSLFSLNTIIQLHTIVTLYPDPADALLYILIGILLLAESLFFLHFFCSIKRTNIRNLELWV